MMSISAPPKNFRVSFKDPNLNPGVKTRYVGDEGNPLSSLQFEPAWDSDELFDALRIAYPRIKSHKDRFLRAVIEFYDAELGRARNSGKGLDTPPSSPPGMMKNDCFLGSGEGGSSSEDCESSVLYSINRRNGANQLKQAKPIVDGIESMQATFSIVPGGTKPRTKRPMTDEERKQYRHTKRVGACEPCRKRKRKCVCKLKEETQIPDAKRARISEVQLSRADSSLTTKEQALSAEKDHLAYQDDQALTSDIASPYALTNQALDDPKEDMAVTQVTKSLSLSPLSLAFDSQFDLPNFSLCPELNLGDLVMLDLPVPNLGLHEGPFIFEAGATPDSSFSLGNPHRLQSLNSLDQCDAYINFPAADKTPRFPSHQRLISRQNAFPLGYPDSDFTGSLTLISRAMTALAPFSRFAPDAQLLLSDLRTLKLQLKLLRKPLPFLAKSVAYYNTVRDVALDIREPLQEFLTRLEKMCGLENLDGQRLGLSYTSTAFQLRKLEWVRSVKDDARRLRGMIASRSTTISSLMTLVSMETLTELHNIFHPVQNPNNDIGMETGIVSDFSHFI